MNQASHWTRYFVAAAGVLFNPSHCWAADSAVLPWDYPLEVIQNFVIGPLAHFVIVSAAICAVLGFALAGDNELVRRLARAAVGTGAALIAVQLLNYLVP
jgi:type IV secretory pathway VirB2 component (pilin)